MMRRRHWLVVGCAGALVATTLVGVGAGAAASSPARSKAQLVTIDIPAPAGEIASKWLNYPGPPRANVLLPPGYNPRKHYPLVVFLNGLDFNYDSYAQYGLTKPFAVSYTHLIYCSAWFARARELALRSFGASVPICIGCAKKS